MHAGSTWLSIAIENALLIGAHQYRWADDSSAQKLKKRLWWSIILRDRIMPLALRRTPQINHGNFEIPQDGLGANDLVDDIECPGVYDKRSKMMLADVLQSQCQLALTLTKVLTICYTPSLFTEPVYLSGARFRRELSDIDASKADLRAWHDNFQHLAALILKEEGLHPFVILYSELTFIYYKYENGAFPVCFHHTTGKLTWFL
jgi:hypothetical protein